jgi:hypothetical protein
MKPVIVKADTLEVKRDRGSQALAPYIDAANKMAIQDAMLFRFDDLENVPPAQRQKELTKQAKAILICLKKRLPDKKFAYRALVDGNVAIVRGA